MLLGRAIKLQILLLTRDKNQWLLPFAFMLLVVVLFPLVITKDSKLLESMAAGIIWIAGLLALMLFINVFESDFRDGCLHRYIVSTTSLIRVIVAKLIAHLALICMVYILVLPIMALWLNFSLHAALMLYLTLIIGMPTVFVVGVMLASLTLGLQHSSVLTTLLLLPLSLPTIIFACGVMQRFLHHQPCWPLLLIMLAFFLIAISFAIPILVYALRAVVIESI